MPICPLNKLTWNTIHTNPILSQQLSAHAKVVNSILNPWRLNTFFVLHKHNPSNSVTILMGKLKGSEKNLVTNHLSYCTAMKHTVKYGWLEFVEWLADFHCTSGALAPSMVIMTWKILWTFPYLAYNTINPHPTYSIQSQFITSVYKFTSVQCCYSDRWSRQYTCVTQFKYHIQGRSTLF